MVTTYAWADIRDRAIHQFGGEAVGATTETSIIAIFERQPALVVNEIERVAADHASGKVSSGWAVLKARLQRIEAASDIVVTDQTEKRKAVRHAEQWIRAAGKHFDREAEVDDALFGDLGTLRDWHTDHNLRSRLLGQWREVRPEGERIEQQAVERGLRNQAARLRKPASDDIPLPAAPNATDT